MGKNRTRHVNYEKRTRMGLTVIDVVILFGCFLGTLLVIWLDFLAHEGVGISLNLFGTPRTSYAILVEVIILSSTAVYGIAKRDARFLFIAGILVFIMFVIGSVMGAA